MSNARVNGLNECLKVQEKLRGGQERQKGDSI